MTEMVTPRPEIARDRFGRPLVVPPEGGKPVPYTRCTTFVGAIEDTWNLSRWQQRMVAIGLAERKDLLLSVVAHKDDKEKLNQICDDAAEAAKAHAGATIGTALHSLTEQMDRGIELGAVPSEYAPDLAAYAEATADLHATHIEEFCVLDRLRIGGTPDRVVRYKGKRYIADLKTGSIDYGYIKIAAQLAVYARSHLYDIATHERSDHGADLTKGIVIHLPAGSGTCRLYWVDLITGWDAVRLSREVRDKRAMRLPQVFTTFGDVMAPMGEQATLDLDTVPGVHQPSLAEQIVACTTADQVRALWQANASVWTNDLTETARLHIAGLPTPPSPTR